MSTVTPPDVERARARVLLATRLAVVLGVVVALGCAVALALVLLRIEALTAADLKAAEGIARQAKDNHRVARRVEAITSTLKDCTSPEGRCYRRGEAQDAAQVGAINSITYYAAACADRPGAQTVRQVKACVGRILSHADNKP